MDKLLIAGIDPGTIGAYALIDLKGNIVNINSGRDFDKSKIIFEMIKHGKIFLIGCDVCQCPNAISKIASNLGAKVVSPDHDLKYFEKIKIMDNFLKTKKDFVKLNNKHEKDALVAALYGLKSVNTLIKKIDDHLKQNNKVYLFEDVKRKVLLENIPITKAVELLS